MADELIADLDNGPDHCILSILIREFGRDRSLADKARYFLPFTLNNPGALKKAHTLQSLLSDYAEVLNKPTYASRITTTSICKWIFYTNKLEFCSLPSLVDTIDCLSGVHLKSQSGYAETVNTYNLLKENYAGFNQDWKLYNWDEEKIKKAHIKLLDGITCTNKCVPGEYRQYGALAANLDKTDHLFPQHKLIPSLMKSLGLVCYDLAKYIGTQVTDRHLLYTFALAAFAQFHFVDIHPFSDGNGRMCRYISKFILDRVLPVPFPMFLDRDVYLKALEEGRKSALDQAPVNLFHLLLDEAIHHYTAIVNEYKASEFDHFIMYTNWKEVKEQLVLHKVDEPEKYKQDIEENDSYTIVSKDNQRIRIKKELLYQADSVDDL